MISTPLDPTRISREAGVALVRPGTLEDAILGLPPSVVAYPESVGEVASLLAWANIESLKVTPTGIGSKLDRGNAPEGCDILMSLSRLDRIIEHAAGDMTVTVEAGVLLDDLQAALAKEGQFLAIDSPIPGSIGGLIATADSGHRRLRYGGVRDLILGVTFVRADGVTAKGGGKVVKNVAGYDMPKLLTGSMGTLSVIVEATFRLYPISPGTATVVAHMGISDAGSWAGLVKQSLVPTAIDFSRHRSGTGIAAVRFEGTVRAVRSQAERAEAMLLHTVSGDILDGDSAEAVWHSFDGVMETDQGDVLARLITTPSDLPGLVSGILAQAEEVGVEVTARAHLGHGHALVRWHQPGVEPAGALLRRARTNAEARSSNLVVWRAPLAVRGNLDVWGDPGEGISLMRSIKQQFDPSRTLNAGRFVGGI